MIEKPSKVDQIRKLRETRTLVTQQKVAAGRENESKNDGKPVSPTNVPKLRS
jgi:hypothetical protein